MGCVMRQVDAVSVRQTTPTKTAIENSGRVASISVTTAQTLQQI